MMYSNNIKPGKIFNIYNTLSNFPLFLGIFSLQ